MQTRIGPAPLLLSVAFAHQGDDINTTWSQDAQVPSLASCRGYRRSRHFRLQSQSVLSGFVRSHPRTASTWLSLYEFDGQELPWAELSRPDEIEGSQDGWKGIKDVDWASFRLVRTF